MRSVSRSTTSRPAPTSPTSSPRSASRPARELARKHRGLLAAIESAYGVDRHVLLAIWGIESAYGTAMGSRSVVRSLATLAVADSRRAAFWRNELIAALRILQDGQTAPRPSSAPGPAPSATRSSSHRLTPRTPSTSTRTAAATSGATSPTRWPRPPTTCARPAGRPARHGASRSSCRPTSTTAGRRPGRSQTLSQWLAAGVRIPAPRQSASRAAAAAGAAGRCAGPRVPRHAGISARSCATTMPRPTRSRSVTSPTALPAGRRWPRPGRSDRPLPAPSARNCSACWPPGARYRRRRRHHGRPDAGRHPRHPAQPRSGRGWPSQLRTAAAAACRSDAITV